VDLVVAANGLSKAWSARLLYSGGSGFINTGFIGVELYHIDCNNFLTQEGVTRQFDENILPFTSLRRVGSDRIKPAVQWVFYYSGTFICSVLHTS
jgi:hypothetical protein